MEVNAGWAAPALAPATGGALGLSSRWDNIATMPIRALPFLLLLVACRGESTPKPAPEPLAEPIAETAPAPAPVLAPPVPSVENETDEPKMVHCESDSDCVLYARCCDCPFDVKPMTKQAAAFYEQSCGTRSCGGCNLPPSPNPPTSALCVDRYCVARP